jgi:hypothetical protein
VSINHKKIAVVIGITYIGDTPKFIVEIIYATILEQVVGSSYGSGICGLILFACRIEATIGSSGRSTQGTVSSPIRLVESPSNTERVGGSFRSKLIWPLFIPIKGKQPLFPSSSSIVKSTLLTKIPLMVTPTPTYLVEKKCNFGLVIILKTMMMFFLKELLKLFLDQG